MDTKDITKAKAFLNEFWSNGNHNDHCIEDVYNVMEAYRQSQSTQMRDRIEELERNETRFRNFIKTEHLTELWDLFFKTALNNKEK